MVRAAPLSFRPPRPGEAKTALEKAPGGKKGRGATSNASGRYEKHSREDFDDGWSSLAPENAPGDARDDAALASPPIATDVTIESPRKIVTYNDAPDLGFDRSINPYRGCEHGCIYCFARPTHAYMGLSPGLDFETRLFAKPNAARLLEKELSAPKYKARLIAMGTNTDPYQPVEKKFQIMRALLPVFAKFGHPVTILTKSALITRDIDLLAPLAERNLVRVALSVTTEDRSLARHMEPRASAPEKRFEAIRRLSDAGISVGVMTAPMIPGLNDAEMESLLQRAKEAGATSAGYTIVRLVMEVSPLFQEWLEAYAPARAKRIMRHIRDINGGRDYDPQRSRPGANVKSTYSKLISQRFRKACDRIGLNRDPSPLDLKQFCAPVKANRQMNLFD